MPTYNWGTGQPLTTLAAAFAAVVADPVEDVYITFVVNELKAASNPTLSASNVNNVRIYVGVDPAVRFNTLAFGSGARIAGGQAIWIATNHVTVQDFQMTNSANYRAVFLWSSGASNLVIRRNLIWNQNALISADCITRFNGTDNPIIVFNLLVNNGNGAGCHDCDLGETGIAKFNTLISAGASAQPFGFYSTSAGTAYGNLALYTGSTNQDSEYINCTIGGNNVGTGDTSPPPGTYWDYVVDGYTKAELIPDTASGGSHERDRTSGAWTAYTGDYDELTAVMGTTDVLGIEVDPNFMPAGAEQAGPPPSGGTPLHFARGSRIERSKRYSKDRIGPRGRRIYFRGFFPTFAKKGSYRRAKG